MSRNPYLYLFDVLIAINKISRYIKNFQYASSLLHSELHWDGTIRELEIIGEATNNLIKHDILTNKHRRIVDFRNQLSHAYFGIDEDMVWDIIKNKLPVYESEVLMIICNVEKIKIEDILQYQKEEYLNNKHILKLLKKLENRIYK